MFLDNNQGGSFSRATYHVNGTSAQVPLQKRNIAPPLASNLSPGDKESASSQESYAMTVPSEPSCIMRTSSATAIDSRYVLEDEKSVN